MEALEVDYQVIPFLNEDAAETRVPYQLLRPITGAAVDGLRERIVHAGQQDEELALVRQHVIGCRAMQRAARIDRVDESPSEWEERYAAALERQQVILAHASLGRIFKAAEDDLGLEFDDLIAARVGHAEHEGAHFAVWRND